MAHSGALLVSVTTAVGIVGTPSCVGENTTLCQAGVDATRARAMPATLRSKPEMTRTSTRSAKSKRGLATRAIISVQTEVDGSGIGVASRDQRNTLAEWQKL